MTYHSSNGCSPCNESFDCPLHHPRSKKRHVQHRHQAAPHNIHFQKSVGKHKGYIWLYKARLNGNATYFTRILLSVGTVQVGRYVAVRHSCGHKRDAAQRASEYEHLLPSLLVLCQITALRTIMLRFKPIWRLSSRKNGLCPRGSTGLRSASHTCTIFQLRSNSGFVTNQGMHLTF